MKLKRRLLRFPLLTLLASLAIYGAACSSDPASNADPSAELDQPTLEGVVYETGTNDEGLELLLDADSVVDAAQSPVVTMPEEAAALSEPTAFEYAAAGVHTELRPRRVPSSPPVLQLLGPLRALVGPERNAHAHGATMNGAAFFLSFEDDRGEALLRVFTKATSFTPDADSWAAFTKAGSVTLTVTLGFFEEGRLATDGGPFQSRPLHFTAVP